MNILIVYAHPEPKSFNGALKDLAVQVFTEQGHYVEVSDLYAQGFNPVGGHHDFTQVDDPEFFKYGMEQTKASELKTFAPDVVTEQEKLLRADVVIFQFPLWWFGLPAILKGWVDRIFAAGLIYGSGKWYSDGVMKGKKAFVSLTTGGGPAIYSPTGLNGDIHSI
ncbi:MAG: NAD(P)H-dependent oxidoreductase, partial [Cyanobacteria bacterium]|nr:NAD(P)H-dependent oxidoreductase [Cyanobacteriota bacterium]